MLQVGRLGCPSHTQGCPQPQLANWSRSHFATFCIVSSPLVLSIHPSDENLAPILDIIGNKGAMAVNQAWAGHPGSLVRNYPPASPPLVPVAGGFAVVTVVCDDTDVTQLGWTYDAAVGALRQGGRCLSTDGYDIPINLFACNNASTYQNFTYEAATGQFSIMAPAGGVTLYLGCLQAGAALKGELPAKVDVYRCSSGNVNERFELDTTGALRSKQGGKCLAGRDRYVPPSPGVAGVQLWSKPLGGGRTAALFINGGGLSTSAEVNLKELNITSTSATVSDVWTGKDAGPVSTGVWQTGTVGSLDSRFVIFTVDLLDSQFAFL